MNWKRKEAGHYVSKDGRFTIRKVEKSWLLYDNEVHDEFGQVKFYSTPSYRSAKNTAKRLLKRESA